ncbi:transposase [Streptomyces fulvorobeus]|uniref:transposase n=1 Tax=Streptomyces fulvorobeus TaxID=284028 RepID=UPI0015677D1F
MDHGVVLRRHELSYAEWQFVRPLLPASLRRRKRLDDRRVLDGIVWKFRIGGAWRHVLRAIRPEGHAPYPFPQTGGGRNVRPDAPGRPGDSRCGRRRRLTRLGGLHDSRRPPNAAGARKEGTRARPSAAPEAVRRCISPTGETGSANPATA